MKGTDPVGICRAGLSKAVLLGGLMTWTAVVVRADHGAPHPVRNPDSPVMLAGDWVQDDARRIDFDRLPRVPSEHSTVSDVRDAGGMLVNQHNYLAHFDGRLVFTKLGYLVGGRHVDYPHVIEHDKHLYVAFASAKQTVEVLKIRIADLEADGTR